MSDKSNDKPKVGRKKNPKSKLCDLVKNLPDEEIKTVQDMIEDYVHKKNLDKVTTDPERDKLREICDKRSLVGNFDELTSTQVKQLTKAVEKIDLKKKHIPKVKKEESKVKTLAKKIEAATVSTQAEVDKKEEESEGEEVYA